MRRHKISVMQTNMLYQVSREMGEIKKKKNKPKITFPEVYDSGSKVERDEVVGQPQDSFACRALRESWFRHREGQIVSLRKA